MILSTLPKTPRPAKSTAGLPVPMATPPAKRKRKKKFTPAAEAFAEDIRKKTAWMTATDHVVQALRSRDHLTDVFDQLDSREQFLDAIKVPRHIIDAFVATDGVASAFNGAESAINGFAVDRDYMDSVIRATRDWGAASMNIKEQFLADPVSSLGQTGATFRVPDQLINSTIFESAITADFLQAIRPHDRRICEIAGLSDRAELIADTSAWALPSSFFDAFRHFQHLVSDPLPWNWATRYESDVLESVLKADGIPIVYIPRAEIVDEVVSQEDRESRIRVLMDRVDDVLADCDEELAGELEDDLTALAAKVREAINAYRDGHATSAQALAVLVCDTMIRAHLDESHQRALVKAEKEWKLTKTVQAKILRYSLAMTPVYRFLYSWRRGSGSPIPTFLQRHISVHHVRDDQYSPENAVLALMLASSLVLAFNEKLSVDRAESDADDAA